MPGGASAAIAVALAAAAAGPATAAGTRVGTGTFYTNIVKACEDAEKVFRPFIPNGIPNIKFNYTLNITPYPGKPNNTINITIEPLGRAPDANERMLISVTVSRTQTGTSEGYISALQVGDWSSGEKPDFLKGKRIGYFLIFIYLYISRKLGLSKIELEDMSQIPKYYEFMGFTSYNPEFSPEELTRYYQNDSGWNADVIKIFGKLKEKNDANPRKSDKWNWLNVDNAVLIQRIKNVTPLPLPGSHGVGISQGMVGGGRKRRFKQRKTKRQRKTKKRIKSRRRKYN
jgi:hypothetical protein